MKTIMTSVNQSWTKQSQRVPCQLNTRRLSKVRTRTVEAGLMLVMYLLVLPAASGQARSVFNDCGGHLTAPQGIIQSPNFPRPFPVPISCRWVIHVPADSKTVIYFTQVRLSLLFFFFYLCLCVSVPFSLLLPIFLFIYPPIHLSSFLFFYPASLCINGFYAPLSICLTFSLSIRRSTC